MGCQFLLQGIFLTQGMNSKFLCLRHWQVDSLPLPHLGNPLLTYSFHNEVTQTKLLKQQKFIVSQLYRLEVRAAVVGRATSPL